MDKSHAQKYARAPSAREKKKKYAENSFNQSMCAPAENRLKNYIL